MLCQKKALANKQTLYKAWNKYAKLKAAGLAVAATVTCNHMKTHFCFCGFLSWEPVTKEEEGKTLFQQEEGNTQECLWKTSTRLATHGLERNPETQAIKMVDAAIGLSRKNSSVIFLWWCLYYGCVFSGWGDGRVCPLAVAAWSLGVRPTHAVHSSCPHPPHIGSSSILKYESLWVHKNVHDRLRTIVKGVLIV